MRTGHRSGRTALAIAVALALSASLVSSAGARVPRFNPKTIVPGTSIGGVKLGMTKAQAVAVWGTPDRCQPDANATWCVYTARSTLKDGNVVGPNPFAGFYLRSRRIIAVNLETAENAAVDPKLNRLKTSRGISLTSTMSAVRRAYRLPAPSGGEAGLSRALFKQQRNCTMFYAPEKPYSDLQAITVGLCKANVGLLIGVR